MRRRARRLGFPLLAAMVVSLAMGFSRPGGAMPSFTRATGEPCAQCHAGFSRLRPYGASFLEHGYRVPSTLSLETNTLRVPLSVDGGLGHELRRAPEHPRDLSIITAAPLEAPGHHAMSALAEAGIDSSRAHIDRAWLEFDGGGHQALRAGAFDAELPFLSARRQTTLAPYLAPVSIAARGFELREDATHGEFGAGLIESHRALSPLERMQDSYLWARREWGRNDLGARLWFDRQDSNVPPLSWLQHLQYLVAARWSIGGMEVVPAYLQDRFDDRPVLKNHDKRHYMLLETFVPLDRDGRWSTTARYERLYHTRTPLTPERDEWLGVVDLAYRMKPNAQLAAEWDDRGTRLGAPGTRRVDASLRVAF